MQTNWRTIQSIFIACLFFLNCKLNAQNYPIQTTVFLTPPYTLSLPQYASSDRLNIQLLNKDFATPVVQVYLQLRIDGPGITLETKPTYRSAIPITLTAGIPTLLSGQDIADLFNTNNLVLQGINESQFLAGGAYLPEGLYSFSIMAKEYHNALQVSNWGTATTGIFKHLPPIINLPLDQSYVSNQTPQFFQIQFTPRHTISADLMQSVRYRIRMNEVYPTTRNANEVMLSSSLPFFETITDQTSFVYGASEPLLIEGRTYALQVQAIDVNGKSIFDNNGFSQVVSFVYGSACPTPQNIITTAGDGTGLQINWDANQRCRSYVVYYKEEGQKNFLSTQAFSNQLRIPQLKANQIYQIKVSGVCAETESDPSALYNFKTIQKESAYQQFAKQCGKPLPSIDLSNAQALLSLENGDVIKAADFDVKVTAATGGNGWFSGAGFVTLPFTGKVPLPCTFDHIFLNTDKRLIKGEIKLLQAPLEISDRTVKNLGKTWRTLFGNNWNRYTDINYTGSITKVTRSDNGDLLIEGSNGSQKLPKGSNTVLTDANGKKYFISAGGQVSEAEGPSTAPIVKDLKSGEGTPKSLPPGMAKVFFNVNVQEGYDAMGLAQLTAGKTYDQLESNDTTYYAAWKLIQSAEKITLEAEVVQSKKWPCPLDSIRFVRSDGTLLPFTRKGNLFSIQATGRLNLYADAIWAVANYSVAPKQASQRWILGKLNLINVDVKKQNLVLVPVNGLGADLQAAALENKMNQLLKQYALQFNVKLGEGLNVKDYDATTEVLEAEKTDVQLGYSNALNRFITAYKNKQPWLQKNRNNDTNYIFVLNLSKDAVKGFMSLGESYGFVFLNNAELNPHTLAHELGHGRFQLEHVFGMDLNKAANTQNLMDYAAPFALLNFDQWMQIFDPQLKVNLFANEDKSKALAIGDISKFKPLANADGTYTFISHSGEYITLPHGAKNLKFSTLGRGYLVEEKEGVEIRKATNYLFPLGCLMGFECKGIKYKARMGIGYVDDNDQPYAGELASNASKAGIMPYLVFANNTYTTKAALFKSRLNHPSNVKTGEGVVLNSFAVIDFETTQLNTDYASAILSKKVGDKIIEDIGASFSIFGNDQLYFRYKDTLMNASQFLVTILSSQRTVADYVYYFNLANLKPNAYASFVNCLSAKQQERAIAIEQHFIAQHQANKGESTVIAKYINSNSEQLFEAINAIQLKDLAMGAASGVDFAKTIHKALVEKWKADYLYNYLKNNTPKVCEFAALEPTERLYAINTLIANADYWHIGDLPLINTLLSTTPDFDVLELLQKGAMANQYAWLRHLWNNKDDEAIGEAFDILNAWVYEHYAQLNIAHGTNNVLAEDLWPSAFTYEKRYNEYYVGIKANTEQLTIVPQQFALRCTGVEESGGSFYNANASNITFSENGSIAFAQTYFIKDIRPQVYPPNQPPHLITVVDYNEQFSPFELITVTLGGNYFELGLAAGQTMEMPAFMAMQLQDRLEQQVTTERTRKIVNMVVIGVSAVSAVVTQGATLNLTATLCVATSTADLAVNNYKNSLKTQAEWNANQAFFHEWEAFHTAAEFAMAVEGAYVLGKALPKMGAKIKAIKSWNLFKRKIKKLPLQKEVIAILDDLIEEVKGLEPSNVQSLNKLDNVSASLKINWKNLDDTYVVWTNPESNALSTAKSFANETGTSLYDAVLGKDFYVKIDISDGRILLAETDGTYHAFGIIEDNLMGKFKASLISLSDDAFKKAISEFVCIHADKLKIISGVSTKSLSIAGKLVNLSREKVNTILGRYKPDIKDLFDNLGSYKNVGLGEVNGGINLLNRPQHYEYLSAEQWWNTWNKQWLENAIKRGDDIYLATEVNLSNLFDFTKKPTTYSFEVRCLIKYNYRPINIDASEWTRIKELVKQNF